MNEQENQSFKTVFAFYQKWRSVIIETDEQWSDFARDAGQMGVDLDIQNNPLGWYLMNAVLETFNELYKGGMKPVPANYFGRDDI